MEIFEKTQNFEGLFIKRQTWGRRTNLKLRGRVPQSRISRLEISQYEILKLQLIVTTLALNDCRDEKKSFNEKLFLRVVHPVWCFKISYNDISAVEYAYALQSHPSASFLTLNKIAIKYLSFKKISKLCLNPAIS